MRSTVSILRLWKAITAVLSLAACASAPQSQPDPQPSAASTWPKPAPSSATSATGPQTTWPTVQQTQHEPKPPLSASAAPAPRAADSARDNRPPSGCFQGHAYAAASALTLPLDYTRAPVAELQACSFDARVSAGALVFQQARAGSAYVLRYQGTFGIAEPGSYTFQVTSATAWRLRVDDVVLHKHSDASSMQLSAGPHLLVLEYYYPAGEAFAFDLQIKTPHGVQTALTVGDSSSYRVGLTKRSQNPTLAREYARIDTENGQINLQSQIQFSSSPDNQMQLDETSEYLMRALAGTLLEHREIARLSVECSCVERGWSRAGAVRAQLIEAGVPPHRVVAACVGLPSDTVEISEGLGSDFHFVIQPSVPASVANGWTPTREANALLGDLKALVASKLGLTPDDILGTAQLSADDWYQVFVNANNSRSSSLQGWRLGLSYSPDGSRRDLGIFERTTPLAWTPAEAARLKKGKANATLYGQAGHFFALVQLRDNVYASISHSSRAELINVVTKLDARDLQAFVRASYGESASPMYVVKPSGDPGLLEELAALVGTAPSEMFKRPQLDKQLRRMLGKNYAAFKARWDLAKPIARRGDYIVGEGMMAHQGGSEEAYFAFGIVAGDIHCGVRVLERLKVYSSPGTKPPEAFEQVLGAQTARGRALFGK